MNPVSPSGGTGPEMVMESHPRSLDLGDGFPQFHSVKEHLNWIKRMLGADGPDSPEEENAEVLKRMAADGDDLTKARDIDFNHLFSREKDAVAFEEVVREQGYPKVSRDFWPEEDGWLTSVHVRMVPDLEEITATEQDLNEIALNMDGKPDGWGCMEVVGTAAR